MLRQASYSECVCGMESHIHQPLKLTLDRQDWSDSRPSHFITLSLSLTHVHTHTHTKPMNTRPGGTQSLSGRLGGEKYLPSLPGIEPRFLGYPTCIPETRVNRNNKASEALATSNSALYCHRIYSTHNNLVLAGCAVC